jgi:osmoprotectant transport system permease protein
MSFFVDLYRYLEQGFLYIFNQWDRVSKFFFNHLNICWWSLLISILIAFPLGLLVSRVRRLYSPTMGVLNILYTIPSLAFLALVVPFFGLSATTTIIVLVAYAQTILVRNIAVGFNGVDSSVVEAARGMGMSGWQRLYKVEFPLALPVILAGLRVAALAIISIATIGAWVGAETLGELMRTDNPRLNSAGIICVVFIALVADQIFRLFERWSVRWRISQGTGNRG